MKCVQTTLLSQIQGWLKYLLVVSFLSVCSFYPKYEHKVKLRWNCRRLFINTRPPILEYFAIFLIETIYKTKPQILIPTSHRIRVFFLPITHITQTHQLSVHHLRRTLSSSRNKSSNSMKYGDPTVFISIIICVGLAVFNQSMNIINSSTTYSEVTLEL